MLKYHVIGHSVLTPLSGGEHSPSIDLPRTVGYRTGCAPAQKAHPEADGGTEYLLWVGILR